MADTVHTERYRKVRLHRAEIPGHWTNSTWRCLRLSYYPSFYLAIFNTDWQRLQDFREGSLPTLPGYAGKEPGNTCMQRMSCTLEQWPQSGRPVSLLHQTQNVMWHLAKGFVMASCFCAQFISWIKLLLLFCVFVYNTHSLLHTHTHTPIMHIEIKCKWQGQKAGNGRSLVCGISGQSSDLQKIKPI